MALDSATIKFGLSGVVQTSDLDLVTASSALPIGTVTTAFADVTLTNGTGANQATSVSSDTRTLVSPFEDLDLSGGIVDAFGNPLALTRLVFLMIKSHSTNIMNFSLGQSVAAPITSLWASSPNLALKPGACVFWACPTAAAYGLTAGAADTLSVVHGLNPFPLGRYDIVVIGS